MVRLHSKTINLRKLSIILLLVVLSFPLVAQQGELGNWIMYFGQNKLSDKWSIHTEAQYRNHKIVPNSIEQLLLRTGMNYHFAANAFVTAGYAYIASHVFESEQSYPESEEHRIWQQLIINNQIGRVKLEHRYRIEQRWVNLDYRNRFRYRIMAFVPLNKPKIEEGAIFLGLYDEVFVNGKQIYFDRNRAYGALGYQFSKFTGIQVGMLHQETNNLGKWYLQFALLFNPKIK